MTVKGWQRRMTMAALSTRSPHIHEHCDDWAWPCRQILLQPRSGRERTAFAAKVIHPCARAALAFHRCRRLHVHRRRRHRRCRRGAGGRRRRRCGWTHQMVCMNRRNHRARAGAASHIRARSCRCGLRQARQHARVLLLHLAEPLVALARVHPRPCRPDVARSGIVSLKSKGREGMFSGFRLQKRCSILRSWLTCTLPC